MVTDEMQAIRAKYKEVLDLHHRTTIEQKRLELMIAECHERHRVAAGYAVDVLGDGKVKPAAQCAQTLEE